MRHSRVAGAVLLFALISTASAADSIWARREPMKAFLFEDLRARHVGDVLTITVSENTGVNETEARGLSKSTGFTDKLGLSGNYGLGAVLSRSGTGTYAGAGSSTRTFNGSSSFVSGRTFTDIVTVCVIDVLPNGNLVVEGTRTRLVAGEMRTLRITGMVRPADIDSGNNVFSQVVGDFRMLYVGHGQDTAVNNPSWFKRILFGFWPN